MQRRIRLGRVKMLCYRKQYYNWAAAFRNPGPVKQRSTVNWDRNYRLYRRSLLPHLAIYAAKRASSVFEYFNDNTYCIVGKENPGLVQKYALTWPVRSPLYYWFQPLLLSRFFTHGNTKRLDWASRVHWIKLESIVMLIQLPQIPCRTILTFC